MTHTNEFLRGMLAAYMGCECEITETQDNITTKTKAKSSGVVSERVHFAGAGLFVHFSKLKPILTPLSEITDEDKKLLPKCLYLFRAQERMPLLMALIMKKENYLYFQMDFMEYHLLYRNLAMKSLTTYAHHTDQTAHQNLFTTADIWVFHS